MLTVPPKLGSAYNRFLVSKGIQQKYHPFYRKWFRYYLDYCHKYCSAQSDENTLSAFIAKLRDKNQSEFMQKQARHAVTLYFEMQVGSQEIVGKDKNSGAGTSEKKADSIQLYNQPHASREEYSIHLQAGVNKAQTTFIFMPCQNGMYYQHYFAFLSFLASMRCKISPSSFNVLMKSTFYRVRTRERSSNFHIVSATLFTWSW